MQEDWGTLGHYQVAVLKTQGMCHWHMYKSWNSHIWDTVDDKNTASLKIKQLDKK